MNVDEYLQLARTSIETALLVSAPMLILGLAAGFAVSVFQAATQINDAALAFIPKICAAIFGMIVFGHFIVNRIATFTTQAFEKIGTLSP